MLKIWEVFILITITNVSKTYKKTTALRDVSITLQPGKCFGLIGPNGAGKSTLMKIIVGIIQSDAGSVSLHNKKNTNWKKSIGYVPQEICLEETVTAEQNLAFFGELYGLKKAALRSRIEATLHTIGLHARRNDKVSTFSGGMKRRLHIGCALLHEPSVVIMDEPTAGIDPQSRQHIYHLINHLKGKQCTVLYSSHYIEEVEKICDDVAFIDDGKVLLTDSMDQLIATHASPAIYIEWVKDASPSILKKLQHVTAHKQGWLIQTDQTKRMDILAMIIQNAKENNFEVEHVAFTQSSLEDIFFTLTGKALRD